MGSLHTAITRRPGSSFALGITESGLGPPDLERALEQHAGYVAALEDAGVRVVELEPDPDHPDSTFVEDTAVLAGNRAVLTRPGAPSRRGEVPSIRKTLAPLVGAIEAVVEPGTVDGGDVLETEREYLVGISERTNEEGARQLLACLRSFGMGGATIDIRGVPGLLHLKTGVSHLGGRSLLAWSVLAAPLRDRGYDVEVVPEEEAYAANLIRVNGRIFIAAGFPQVARLLGSREEPIVLLEMSEFQKMDGGLSCLSLRISGQISGRTSGS